GGSVLGPWSLGPGPSRVPGQSWVPGPSPPRGLQDARTDQGQRPRTKDGRGAHGPYARHSNGAYWPLFVPVVSFHDRPSAFTWLRDACARSTRSLAGWPVLASASGSAAFGLIPIASCAAMSTRAPAFTDQP